MDQKELQDFLAKKQWGFSEKGPLFTISFSNGEGRVCITFPSRGERVRIALPVDICHWVDESYALQKTGSEYLMKKEKLHSFLENLEKQFGNLFSPVKGEKEEEWQKKKKALLEKDKTERLTEINSREGQQLLRELLLEKYHSCMIIPEITSPDLLIASHIKPWSECEDDPAERLNENNCLLLSVALDKLFDRHLISFSAEDGHMLISECIDEVILKKLGVFPTMQLEDKFRSGREAFLRSHNARLRIKQ